MKKIIFILLIIPNFILSQNIPDWINDKVKLSLYHLENTDEFQYENFDLESGELINRISLSKNDSKELFVDLAKLNAYKEYYKNLHKESDKLEVLPSLKEFIYRFEIEIHEKYKINHSRNIYNLTGGNSLPVYNNISNVSSESLNEIKENVNTYFDSLTEIQKQELTGSLNPIFFGNKTKDIENGISFLFPNGLYDKKIGIGIVMAKRGGRSSWNRFTELFEEAMTKNDISYKNNLEFLSLYQNHLYIKNRDAIKMRLWSTLFKFAIDSRDYNLLKSALFTKDNKGHNKCNSIDWWNYEIINQKPETLNVFMLKILNEDGMNAVHDFGAIKNLLIRLSGCSQSISQKWELKEKDNNEVWNQSNVKLFYEQELIELIINTK